MLAQIAYEALTLAIFAGFMLGLFMWVAKGDGDDDGGGYY